MKKTLLATASLASLLCLGLAVPAAQAQEIGDQKKKMPDGPPPNLDEERLGDVEPGPPIYEEPDEPGLGEKSPKGCSLDIDGSGAIDLMDMLTVLLQWGECNYPDKNTNDDGLGSEPGAPKNLGGCSGDLNGDRKVDLSDLLPVLFNLNKKCGDGDIVGLP